MILRYRQEAPLASSSQISAKLRRLAHSAVSPKGVEVMELLKETVAGLEAWLDGHAKEQSLSTLQELQRIEDGNDDGDNETLESVGRDRRPFDLAKAVKVAN